MSKIKHLWGKTFLNNQSFFFKLLELSKTTQVNVLNKTKQNNNVEANFWKKAKFKNTWTRMKLGQTSESLLKVILHKTAWLFNATTLRVTAQSIAIKTRHSARRHSANVKRHYAYYCVFFVAMLIAVMLNGVILTVVAPNILSSII
jgi:hypothetical protein